MKRVVGLGNQQWEVDALVGIDSMPSEGVGDFKGTFRFVVASGLLSMNEVGMPVGISQASNFFRCGKVLDGMYEIRRCRVVVQSNHRSRMRISNERGG